MQKYHRDGAFEDPVVRCDSCAKLVLGVALRKVGCCPECGNRRVREVHLLSDADQEWCKDHGVDPDWMALFGPVEEAAHG